MDYDDIVALEDRFTVPTYKKFPFAIARGEGSRVFTTDGRVFLDLYGGHAVAATGHCHPKVAAAIAEQAKTLLFYSNLVPLEIRARAAEAVGAIAPEGLRKVFFVNSGAEAIENAFKLARKFTGKPRILSFEGSFHGRTPGALSATGIAHYREGVSPFLPGHVILPWDDVAALRRELASGDVAGAILEPIQSLGGVRVASAAWLRALRDELSRAGAMLIYDEIQTGFGRTGTAFYSGRHGVAPDFVALAKGIASGVPMGALLVREDLAAKLKTGDLGTTFGGGPLASAACVATLRVFREERLFENVAANGRIWIDELKRVPGVAEVRGEGYIIGLVFPGGAKPVQQALLGAGFITGLSDDPRVLRLLPPLVLTRAESASFTTALPACVPAAAAAGSGVAR